MSDIQVIGVKYVKSNCFGDFEYMYKLEEFTDSLFIFNDNEEYHDTCRCGIGNAVMRRYNKYSKLEIPRSAGIPTGTLELGGYKKLDKHTQTQIDNSINEIKELIKIYKYKRIFFSSNFDGKLGTSIFEVNTNVLLYITNQIYSLSTLPVQIIYSIPKDYWYDKINFNQENEENMSNEIVELNDTDDDVVDDVDDDVVDDD